MLFRALIGLSIGVDRLGGLSPLPIDLGDFAAFDPFSALETLAFHVFECFELLFVEIPSRTTAHKKVLVT